MSALPQQRIQRFLAVLRDNGLRVAQQETSDAFKALALLGEHAFNEREVFQAVLKTTLIKRSTDEPLFDHLFELCFGGGPLGPGLVSLEDTLMARGVEAAQAQQLAEQVLATLAAEGSGGVGQALMQGDDGADGWTHIPPAGRLLQPAPAADPRRRRGRGPATGRAGRGR
jgi:uncharacterized protein with von Willebrand factor type A (vWA) domain